MERRKFLSKLLAAGLAVAAGAILIAPTDVEAARRRSLRRGRPRGRFLKGRRGRGGCL